MLICRAPPPLRLSSSRVGTDYFVWYRHIVRQCIEIGIHSRGGACIDARQASSLTIKVRIIITPRSRIISSQSLPSISLNHLHEKRSECPYPSAEAASSERALATLIADSNARARLTPRDARNAESSTGADYHVVCLPVATVTCSPASPWLLNLLEGRAKHTSPAERTHSHTIVRR